MNDFELSLLYDRLDSLVESGEMTEEEARAEWRDIVAEQEPIDIVRCGECKYCGKDRIKWSEKDDNGDWIDTKCNCCYALSDTKLRIKEVSLHDYCSWGVRKDDE